MAANDKRAQREAKRQDRAAKASSRTLRTLLKAQQKSDGVYRKRSR